MQYRVENYNSLSFPFHQLINILISFLHSYLNFDGEKNHVFREKNHVFKELSDGLLAL